MNLLFLRQIYEKKIHTKKFTTLFSHDHHVTTLLGTRCSVLFHQHFFARVDVYPAFLGPQDLPALKVKPRTFAVSRHPDRMYAFGRRQFNNAALEDAFRPAFSQICRFLAVRHPQHALVGDVRESVLAKFMGSFRETGH